MVENCVIVGASHAAGQVIPSLRQMGWEGNITLIGDENYLPYHHPPLSKDYLSNEKTDDDLLLRPLEAYETAKVNVVLGTHISKINRSKKTIHSQEGEIIPYDKLVLTTGARVRRLTIEGADLPNVFYLRDMDDVSQIKNVVAQGKKAVIIGGGYIGLETAASLKKLGLNVTLLEAMPRILKRVTAPELSAFYKRIHNEEGVKIIEATTADKIIQAGGNLEVVATDGKHFEADFIIIGIGVIPNMELAVNAGLECGNGIVVNQFCQTSDKDIYAAGDVTWHYNPQYARYLRLESVPNATEQAKIVAAHICGQPKPYDSLPWFWSDQFDLKLQIAGLSEGYDDLIIRGDHKSGRSFTAFYFKGDQLLAVDAVNSPRDFAMARMVLAKGKSLNKTYIADKTANLKDAII